MGLALILFGLGLVVTFFAVKVDMESKNLGPPDWHKWKDRYSPPGVTLGNHPVNSAKEYTVGKTYNGIYVGESIEPEPIYVLAPSYKEFRAWRSKFAKDLDVKYWYELSQNINERFDYYVIGSLDKTSVHKNVNTLILNSLLSNGGIQVFITDSKLK